MDITKIEIKEGITLNNEQKSPERLRKKHMINDTFWSPEALGFMV